MARKKKLTPEELTKQYNEKRARCKYRIILQHSTAIPFEFVRFETFEECKEFLDNKLKTYDEENEKYYVVNKFYKNIHSYIEPIDKFTIEFNDNENWIVYEPKENIETDLIEKSKDININVNVTVKIIK